MFSRRRRGATEEAAKGRAELEFWTDHWDRVLRDGGLWGPDVLELAGDDAPADTYEGRRWQQARAEVNRVLREAGIADASFFDGKVVVDIGPGVVGFPDACPAAVSIGVEPLAIEYQRAGLLLDSRAVYLAVGAERIPVRDDWVDVVVSRNSLDHVEDPRAAVQEIKRILRPGGVLILNVDVDHPPTPAEPHELKLSGLREWLAPLAIEREDAWDHGHGGDAGHAVVIVARKPA